MVKNKTANKWLGVLVAVTMALGMLTNALPVPAGIAETSSATNTTETAFTYASRNVVKVNFFCWQIIALSRDLPAMLLRFYLSMR